MTAYDHYLRGLAGVKGYVLNLDLMEHLEKAVEIDPDFSAAHAGLAMMLTFKFVLDHNPATKDSALAHARRSLQLDPSDGRCQGAMGYALVFSNNLEEGKPFIDKAVALNPNDAWTRGVAAYACVYFGRFDEALAEIDVALKLDPFDHNWFWDVRGIALLQMERYAEAIDAFQRLNRQVPWTLVWNAICLAKLGRLGEARRAMAQYWELEPDRAFSVFRMVDEEPYKDPAMRDRLKAVLLEFDLVDASGAPAAG